MNIFATSPDPVASAHALCDRRVNKMILESAQMLSAAIHADPRYASISPHVYRMGINTAWQRHPCTVWTKASPNNFAWLLAHLQALSDEYTYRYERLHPTAQLLGYFYEVRDRWSQGVLEQPSDFANCTSAVNSYDFRELPVHLAYKCALATKWQRLDPSKRLTPNWRKRGEPSWLAGIKIGPSARELSTSH